ncbi:MAG TPA: inner membrane CreD family protein [Pyrinomonadaceae bacterium]|nr:inner membrane CreD family protein [Pyrinomonadaceae bacterium]
MFNPINYYSVNVPQAKRQTSMIKRIAAISFIFLCATVAWAILGATIFERTYDSGSFSDSRVESTWGTPQSQSPPRAWFDEQVAKKETKNENGKTVETVTQESVTTQLPVESSHINVDLNLEHRQKGLLWYSTYKVGFDGNYSFRNPSDQDRNVTFQLDFPTSQAIYDDLVFTVDGETVPLTNGKNSATGTVLVKAKSAALLRVGYQSQGLNDWRYNFAARGTSDGSQPVSEVAQVREFALKMKTNFKDIDFPDNTLSPTRKSETGSGWELEWNYKNLVSGYQIAMTMPEKLQPGPLAGRISFFAPVSLFFFFFLLLIITTLRGIDLHPMNYFFLAAAFFSFHLLLAYLVDHVSIHLAFAICSAVSIFLVISYLRLVVGTRFATREAALAQFIYLVAFSYAFFLKGFTGLAITIGSITTLFVVMQATGKIRWTEKFAPRHAPPELTPAPASTPVVQPS